jgi:long-chain acyl-CoA synthetase
VKEAIKNDMMKYAKQEGLQSFEQAKIIQLQTDQFSVENDLLTPTYKLRRPTFRRMFSESVNEMYGSLTLSQVNAVRSE